MDGGLRYNYTSLLENSQYFRLATLHPASDRSALIECSMQICPLQNNAQPYQALSYVCGDPNNKRPIRVNGKTHYVYLNLDTALRYVRDQVKPLVLWVDSICIHQNDSVEKSAQVSLMSKIYKSAENVLAWLGEEKDESHLALTILSRLRHDSAVQYLERLDDMAGNPLQGPSTATKLKARWLAARIRRDLDKSILPNPFSLKLRKLLEAAEADDVPHRISSPLSKVITLDEFDALWGLLNRSYFHRLWIAQELILSTSILFVCGVNRYDGKSVISGSAALLMMCPYLAAHSLNAGKYLQMLFDIALKMWGKSAIGDLPGPRPLAEQPRCLLTLLHYFKEGDCRDPRDKLFALLGIARDPFAGLNLPEYGLSVTQVYQRLTCTHAEYHKNLEILNLCGASESISSCSWAYCHKSTLMSGIFRSDSQNVYAASRTSRPIARFPGRLGEGAVACFRGYVIDTVGWAGSRLRGRIGRTNPIIQGWQKKTKSGTHNEEDFWLTLTMERRSLRSRATAYQIRQYRRCIIEWLRSGMEQPQDFHLLDAISNCHFISYFITLEGRRGLCEAAMVPGDVVCVLLGGQMPFILRERGDGTYQLLEGAPCYLRGVMDGETMDDLAAGKYEERELMIV